MHRFLRLGRSTASARARFTVVALACLVTWDLAGQFPIAYLAPGFHTATLHPVNAPTADPIVPLDGGQLELGFDDLNPGLRNLQARFIHCTFDWYPSMDLRPSDYLSGFHPVSLTDVEASFGTRIDYTHYRLKFPNDLVQFTKSGNYAVEIFDPASPDTPLLIQRFVLFEDLVEVEVNVTRATKIADQMTHQEVDFVLRSESFPLVDPYDALQTAILQNGRWDNAKVGLPPQFVKGQEIDFNRSHDNAFPGGNTQRFADLKSRRFVSLGMERIDDRGEAFNFYMEPLQRRTYTAYRYREDLGGHFVVSNERNDDATGGEYAWVHWTLEAHEPLYGQEIFLFGGISQWMYSPKHRFIWNAVEHHYELDLLTKQGYYDYLILVRPAGEDHSVSSLNNFPGDLIPFEGSHDETPNTYTVLAYYWDPSGYDRAIGAGWARRDP